jgi:hypothetical protein
MKEQLIEKLKAEILHIFESGANEIRVLNMVEAFINKYYEYEALTSVKSEPTKLTDMNTLSLDQMAEMLRAKYNVKDIQEIARIILHNFDSVKSESAEEALLLQKALNEYISLKHTQEECVGFIDGYKKAMHDFANNSEAMKEDFKYFFGCGRNYQNNAEITFNVAYTEYLTNKEK